MRSQTSFNRIVTPATEAILAGVFIGNDADVQPQFGTVQNFAQDREIFSEGAGADYFYKLVSGTVRTCRFLADGRRQIDAFYVAGDIFGLEFGTHYGLSAEAVTDCMVIMYRKIKLDVGANHDTHLSRELLAFAVRGMARAQAHALLLGRRSAMEKMAGFLLDWSNKSPDRDTVSLAMTRQDIADYLSLTIETVSRTLSQLERDHVIDLPSARQIRLRKLDMLEDLAA
ncbi:MAG TPA: helix-turn-helix domain-containing protein [Rhizomicrobium sp.]|nr:helix-turn-helix domain-containing protein [Rhizomicrobium sp.]